MKRQFLTAKYYTRNSEEAMRHKALGKKKALRITEFNRIQLIMFISRLSTLFALIASTAGILA